MSGITFPLVLTLVILAVVVNSQEEYTGRLLNKNESVHIFILMVPDSSVQALRRRHFRQEEEAVEAGVTTFAQTSKLLSQIITGVLGGDVRPIFAGSIGFVEEQGVQQGLGNFLGAIAPAVNFALREMYVRTQTALGYGPTTLTPMPHDNNLTVYEGGNVTARTMPTSTTSWQWVLNQIMASTTTVEPLPIITLRPDTDDNEDYQSNKIAFDY